METMGSAGSRNIGAFWWRAVSMMKENEEIVKACGDVEMSAFHLGGGSFMQAVRFNVKV
jgi:hypothetical protein